MYKKLMGAVALWLAASGAIAGIPVEISPDYAEILINKTIEFPSKEHLAQMLFPTENHDTFFARVTADNPGATVESYRTADLDRDDYSHVIRYGEVRGKWSHWFSLPPNDTSRVLLFVRPPANARGRIKLEVLRFGKRTADQRKGLADFIRIPLDSLDDVYDIPKFKVVVKPCGAINAFSAPDITICSELVADLLEKDAADALPVVVLHEVGHTLLNLWGLPGWDNEDVVDEFAGSLIVSVRPQALSAMAKWLGSQDSLSAAAVQLSQDERHSIPIQRARNFERMVAEAAAAQKGTLTPTQRRWFALLEPHAKAARPDTNSKQSANEGARQRRDAGAIALAKMVAASGVCERLIINGVDATNLCGNNVIRMVYTNGRSSFVVSTTNKVPLAFSTGLEEPSEAGATFPIDKVSIWHTSADDMENVPAHGKCLVFGAGATKILQCDMATDSNGALSGIRLRFRDWETIKQ